MSVPLGDRTESSIQFLDTFHKMRKECIEVLMRDFGIKKKFYEVQLIEKIYEIEEGDKEQLENILNKYGINNADIEKYPIWIVESMRNSVVNLLDRIGENIEIANSIYVINESELIERRNCINSAIGYCNALKDKLQSIIQLFTVKIGQYEVIFGLIKKEIDLLKGVRKSDSKRFYKKGNN